MKWFDFHPMRIVIALAVAASCAVPAMSLASELSTVSTADHTASAQIPSGWTLASGERGFLFITGPNGERVNLGTVVVAKNGTGGDTSGMILTLPYSLPLRDKFASIIQSGAVKKGMAPPQVTFASETPAKLAGCSNFLGGWTSGASAMKFEGVLCSLPPDILGYYKNLVFLASVPSAVAQQDRPVVEKIAQSYRVTPATFSKMLAPYTATPAGAVGGAGGGTAPGMTPYKDPTGADCFDYNLIRQSPPWEVPMHCGGHMPG